MTHLYFVPYILLNKQWNYKCCTFFISFVNLMTNIIRVMQASATVSSARHVQNQLGILQFFEFLKCNQLLVKCWLIWKMLNIDYNMIMMYLPPHCDGRGGVRTTSQTLSKKTYCKCRDQNCEANQLFSDLIRGLNCLFKASCVLKNQQKSSLLLILA